VDKSLAEDSSVVIHIPVSSSPGPQFQSRQRYRRLLISSPTAVGPTVRQAMPRQLQAFHKLDFQMKLFPAYTEVSYNPHKASLY
jgi:hypothetical protein